MKSVTQPLVTPNKPSGAPATAPNAYERQMLVGLYAASRFTEAETFARGMVKRFPKHGFGYKVLGAALKKLGKNAEALPVLQKAAYLMPTDYEAFNNVGVALKDVGRLEHAVACFERALELKADYADAHGNLGGTLHAQGKVDAALRSYRRKLELTPDDVEAQHFAAALSGETTARPPSAYVENVFDAYADKFDQHLQQALRYETPQRLLALLQQASPAPETKWDILDLGCGTGLFGAAAASLKRQLVGIDLSSKMLEKAAERQLYDRLEHGDLVNSMRKDADASYDVVAAADVFVYIGDIAEVVQEAKRLLRPGGYAAFSFEALELAPDLKPEQAELPYRLGPSSRYAHSAAHIRSLAQDHGFRLLELRSEQIRLDGQVPVMGYLTLWQA